MYDDFIGEIELTHKQRNHLRKLLDFRFAKHNKHHLDKARVFMLKKAIRSRAAEISKK